MPVQKADLLLHPIRMRILMAVAGREMTAQQLLATLKGVPPATLYRQLNRLANAGVLSVVAERRVRGASEKTYTLNDIAAGLSKLDFARVNRDEHLHYFIMFVATLLGDYARYVQRPTAKPAEDGVGYHKNPIYVNDEELSTLQKRLAALLVPLLENKPRSDRQRLLLTTILMPDSDAEAETEPA